MMTATADVLVLGLGPAGASAAAAAARRGCRVLALDRRREAGVPLQCAEFVPAMIGVPLGTLPGAVRQKIGAMATFVEQGAPDLDPRFSGYMLDRPVFDAALVARARQAGADCRFGRAARSLSRSGLVALSDGSEVRARVVIGADGPRSTAGRAIGSVNGALVETRQITVALAAPHAATDIFLSARIPGGYGWLFPRGEFANLGAGVHARARRELKRIVAALHARLVAEGRVGRGIVAATGGAIPADGMVRPRGELGRTLVLLAGDAAGLANPVTGAGIAAAVQSGGLAGEAAARCAAGDRAAAAAYEEELEEIFRPALEHALGRRKELEAAAPAGETALRRGWIAYREYWQ
ncbi:MAG: geranylgeranyl reductase family protein [Burkholderiales bacterium]|nr:geranylgeranyl reductase family protein [Burkholderiales bacterium]